MRRSFSLPTLLFLFPFLFSGCNTETATDVSGVDNTAASESPASVVQQAVEVPTAEPDDAQAVEAVEAMATAVRRDGDGYIIEVDFRGATIDDTALEPLAGLRRLRSVLLLGTDITDAGLVAVGRVPTLENLDLRDCAISNAGIAHLAPLAKLRALRLSGKSGRTTVDDDAMADVAKLESLEVLALDYLWVSEEGLAQLTGLSNLAEVYLAQTLIGDEALAVLAKFPHLRTLRVAQTQVTGEGLAHLKALKELEQLDVSECVQLTDSALAALEDLTTLTWLNLWRVPITDEGVAHLAGLVNMQWLNLDNTQLTDAGLIHLAGMNQLTFLHLGSTAVSDAGVPALEGLTALKDLKVTRTAVTTDGVAQLKAKLPDTEIQLQYIDGQ